MPSKKGHTTPSSIPPSTNSRSLAPSSAASSTGHTDSPLKSYSTGADSSAPKKGGLTFGRSSNEPYATPKQTSSKSSTTTTSSSSSSGPPKLPGSAKDAQKKAQGVVAEAQDILSNIWNRYVDDTPQRVKLVDAFMAFLVALGVVQFAYCVVAGNYPFNAFLSGFSATVGQFVLTASLRIQTNPANKKEFSKEFSDERAFADYVFGSLILHFFCVNFIN